MPNHCENHTSIIGPREDIERLLAVITAPADDHLLAHLYPVPEDVTDSYHWCIENWGTKWGDYDHFSDEIEAFHHNDNTSSISVSYMTAWSPFGENYWRKVSKDYPTLWFTTSYAEQGMCFVGAFAVRNGSIENHETDQLPDWSGEDEDYADWLDAMDELRNTCADIVDGRLAIRGV